MAASNTFKDADACTITKTKNNNNPPKKKGNVGRQEKSFILYSDLLVLYSKIVYWV